jgi:hypothetical protein
MYAHIYAYDIHFHRKRWQRRRRRSQIRPSFQILALVGPHWRSVRVLFFGGGGGAGVRGKINGKLGKNKKQDQWEGSSEGSSEGEDQGKGVGLCTDAARQGFRV